MSEYNNSITIAEEDASIFLEHAMAISKASNSSDNIEKITVLDSNLKLWVEIETTLQSASNILPTEIKQNLQKLSKYVERLTLSKGVNMEKSDYDCLININMQISEGLLEAVKNSMAQEEAFSLLKCAIDLSNAKESSNSADLITALDNNMQLWVYIKTVASSKDSRLPKEITGNLVKLADYVAAQTLIFGNSTDKANYGVIDTMIMTNLQISEGLMANKNISKVA